MSKMLTGSSAAEYNDALAARNEVPARVEGYKPGNIDCYSPVSGLKDEAPSKVRTGFPGSQRALETIELEWPSEGVVDKAALETSLYAGLANSYNSYRTSPERRAEQSKWELDFKDGVRSLVAVQAVQRHLQNVDNSELTPGTVISAAEFKAKMEAASALSAVNKDAERLEKLAGTLGAVRRVLEENLTFRGVVSVDTADDKTEQKPLNQDEVRLLLNQFDNLVVRQLAERYLNRGLQETYVGLHDDRGSTFIKMAEALEGHTMDGNTMKDLIEISMEQLAKYNSVDRAGETKAVTFSAVKMAKAAVYEKHALDEDKCVELVYELAEASEGARYARVLTPEGRELVNVPEKGEKEVRLRYQVTDERGEKHRHEAYRVEGWSRDTVGKLMQATWEMAMEDTDPAIRQGVAEKADIINKAMLKFLEDNQWYLDMVESMRVKANAKLTPRDPQYISGIEAAKLAATTLIPEFFSRDDVMGPDFNLSNFPQTVVGSPEVAGKDYRAIANYFGRGLRASLKVLHETPSGLRPTDVLSLRAAAERAATHGFREAILYGAVAEENYLTAVGSKRVEGVDLDRAALPLTPHLTPKSWVDLSAHNLRPAIKVHGRVLAKVDYDNVLEAGRQNDPRGLTRNNQNILDITGKIDSRFEFID